MAEKVVLTQEELQALRVNQEEVDFITRRHGDLFFQIKYANEELNTLERRMDDLMGERTKMVQRLQEKYGAGTLDLATGEFVKA